MRREEDERAAVRRVVEVLDERPRDREAVEGGRAAAHLVQDDQAPRRRAAQDRRRLEHLHHERRLPAGEVIGGADAREDAVEDRDLRLRRRHERARLREQDRRRDLPQVRRLAAHVRPGDDEDPFLRREVAVVRDERLLSAHRLDDRMARVGQAEARAGGQSAAGPTGPDSAVSAKLAATSIGEPRRTRRPRPAPPRPRARRGAPRRSVPRSRRSGPRLRGSSPRAPSAPA